MGGLGFLLCIVLFKGCLSSPSWHGIWWWETQRQGGGGRERERERMLRSTHDKSQVFLEPNLGSDIPSLMLHSFCGKFVTKFNSHSKEGHYTRVRIPRGQGYACIYASLCFYFQIYYFYFREKQILILSNDTHWNKFSFLKIPHYECILLRTYSIKCMTCLWANSKYLLLLKSIFIKDIIFDKIVVRKITFQSSRILLFFFIFLLICF